MDGHSRTNGLSIQRASVGWINVLRLKRMLVPSEGAPFFIIEKRIRDCLRIKRKEKFLLQVFWPYFDEQQKRR
jgi:hypothetical protein